MTFFDTCLGRSLPDSILTWYDSIDLADRYHHFVNLFTRISHQAKNMKNCAKRQT